MLCQFTLKVNPRIPTHSNGKLKQTNKQIIKERKNSNKVYLTPILMIQIQQFASQLQAHYLQTEAVQLFSAHSTNLLSPLHLFATSLLLVHKIQL